MSGPSNRSSASAIETCDIQNIETDCDGDDKDQQQYFHSLITEPDHGREYHSLANDWTPSDSNSNVSDPDSIKCVHNSQFASLVVGQPLNLQRTCIPVSEQDLSLEDLKDLPKMRNCYSPLVLKQRFLYTQSMPFVTDFEVDFEQVEMVSASDANRRQSDIQITEKYLSLIRNEVVITEEKEDEEEDEATTPTEALCLEFEDLSVYKTL